MASSKLLTQPRWFRFLPRSLSNVRLFSDLPYQHPVSVSEPQYDIDPKSNNRFNKASSTPSSLKEPELAKFSAIADTWSVKYGIFFSSIQQWNWNTSMFFFLSIFIICRWDSEGPFKPLHKMNPTRLAFIRSTLCRHFRDVACILMLIWSLEILILTIFWEYWFISLLCHQFWSLYLRNFILSPTCVCVCMFYFLYR